MSAPSQDGTTLGRRLRGVLPPVLRTSGRLIGTSAYAKAVLQWLVLGVLVGIAAGISAAIFLISLAEVTTWRDANDTIVYLLPFAGLVLGLVYDKWGKSVRAGNNLVLDTIHESSRQVPLRMAPMVLLGTLWTHLFGGSAGREGTAVQMGASIADAIAHRLRLSPALREVVLAAGIAGGFGAAFGTPIAGAIFGLEVVTIGRIEYHALLPALVAAVVADFVSRSLGVVHVPYPVVSAHAVTLELLGKWVLLAIVVAATAAAFVELSHRLRRLLDKYVHTLPLRMFVGGLAVVVMWKVVGTDIYLGLGVPTIVASFSDPNLPMFAFALKLLFTVVTLSAGFIGGEVTPLLFVGAALGNAFGRVMGIPVDLAAGVGLVGVFGAAANTPIALTIMAVELVGANVLPHVAIVTVGAYLLSGHRGIYPSQRIARLKHGGPLFTRLIPLRDVESELAGSPKERL